MTEDRRHTWEDVIDDEIRRVTANYAGRMGLKGRPALSVHRQLQRRVR